MLVVDDDDSIRSLLAYVLGEAGYSVHEAADGEAALAALAKSPPDCAVLDVMMPKLDGFGVLRARRERKLATGTRFLLLTARTAEIDFLHGYELGADAYLTKPFSPDEVAAEVADLLVTSRKELDHRRAVEMEKADLLRKVEWAFSRRRPPTG